ncbi:hypothetical protein D3C86_2104900 [compost metagenome]
MLTTPGAMYEECSAEHKSTVHSADVRFIADLPQLVHEVDSRWSIVIFYLTGYKDTDSFCNAMAVE